MIPQVGFSELLVIGMVALIVVGPKDLPLLMRRVGKMIGQAKRLAREFTASFEELGRQAELEELRKEVEALKRDATGDLDKEMQRTQREINESMRDRPALPPADADGAENRIAPPAAAQAAAQTGPVHPAAAKPAGPRIEPVAQARPRPEPAPAAAPAEPVKTDQAS